MGSFSSIIVEIGFFFPSLWLRFSPNMFLIFSCCSRHSTKFGGYKGDDDGDGRFEIRPKRSFKRFGDPKLDMSESIFILDWRNGVMRLGVAAKLQILILFISRCIPSITLTI